MVAAQREASFGVAIKRLHRFTRRECLEQRHADVVVKRAGPLIRLAIERELRRQDTLLLGSGDQAEGSGGIGDLFGREKLVGANVELSDEGFDRLHCGGAIVALFLRAGDDVAQLVSLVARDRKAGLLLLKFGEALEFGIGEEFSPWMCVAERARRIARGDPPAF